MTLQTNQLIGFGAGGGKVSVALTDNTVDTANASTHTFTSQSIGAIDANRKIVVIVNTGGVSASTSVSSMTINSVAAGLVLAVTNSTEAWFVTEIWQAVVPTGTSVSIVVNWSGTVVNAGIGVYRVIGAASAAYATASDNDSDPLTATIDIPADGVLICGAGEGTAATWSWTNADEDYDETIEAGDNQSGASKAYDTFQSGITITANPSATARPRMALASWGPA